MKRVFDDRDGGIPNVRNEVAEDVPLSVSLTKKVFDDRDGGIPPVRNIKIEDQQLAAYEWLLCGYELKARAKHCAEIELSNTKAIYLYNFNQVTKIDTI